MIIDVENKPKKVKCVAIRHGSRGPTQLTIGKVYEVIRCHRFPHVSHGYIRITNDIGRSAQYTAKNFEPVTDEAASPEVAP